MGKKTGLGEISAVIACSLFLVLSTAWGAPRPDLGLQLSSERMSEPLTTEKAWKIDPGLVNPHRARWAVGHQVELSGLEARRLDDGRFGVKAAGVSAVIRSYVRGPGPWYHKRKNFPCIPEPQENGASLFGTQDGALRAAAVASKFWDSLLEKGILKISVLLAHVSETTQKDAIRAANIEFSSWLHSLDERYRTAGMAEARAAEWKVYRKMCSPGARNIVVDRDSLMEPVPPFVPRNPMQILGRAPVRLWNGLFSVRVELGSGDGKLDGRFLVNSGTAKSVVSPTFMEAQGLNPALVEIPHDLPVKLKPNGPWQGDGDLANTIRLDSASVSNFNLPYSTFLLFDTDYFSPPESVGTCCDGVLGTDFLKNYAVEFHRGPPPELRIYDPKGFAGGPGEVWTEVSISPSGVPVSACDAEGTRKKTDLHGVKWDTGMDRSLVIHDPWKSAASSSARWSVKCGSLTFAKSVSPSSAKNRETARDPAFSVGIPLLERGNFTFDLPHGRIWFDKKALQASVIENRSGLKVKYTFEKGGRVLRVASVAPGSAAARLERVGLKPGVQITRIDSKAAEDLDLWDVNERLAGAYDATVDLEWKTRVGLKLAPLRVR